MRRCLLVGLSAWVIWHMPPCSGSRRRCSACVLFADFLRLGRLRPGPDGGRFHDGGFTLRICGGGPAGTGNCQAGQLGQHVAGSAPGGGRVSAVAVLGNIGQARTWAATAVTAESSQKVLLVATARVCWLGGAGRLGPERFSIGLFPSLSAASIEHLDRWPVTHVPVAPVDLANARALLAVGTWNGIRTELLPKPLSAGRFQLVTAVHGATSWSRTVAWM